MMPSFRVDARGIASLLLVLPALASVGCSLGGSRSTAPIDAGADVVQQDQPEAGPDAPPDATPVPLPVCGDGKLESTEQCDDGNDVVADGCSPQCRWEVTAVFSGVQVTCAAMGSGSIKCWGLNALGGLGLGDTLYRGGAPDQMGSHLPVVDLGAGRTAKQVLILGPATCALLDDGGVKCWGSNGSGQLGLGDVQSRSDQPTNIPAKVPAIDLGTGRTAVKLGSAGEAFCALLDDRSLKCWGGNFFGELARDNVDALGDQPGEMGDNLPRIDFGGTGVAAVAASNSPNTCASLDDGTTHCWGQNSNGQLGLGDTQNRGAGPSPLANTTVDLGTGKTARQIVMGDQHTCALLSDDTVRCWGEGGYGQLGLGDTTSRGKEPNEMGDQLAVVDLGTGRTAKQLTAGSHHTCAILDDSTVKCWGGGDFGALGLGDTSNRGDGPGEMGDRLPPVALGTGRKAIGISSGGQHTCVVLDSHAVKCWGSNDSGQLGLGDTKPRGDDPGGTGDVLPVVDITGE